MANRWQEEENSIIRKGYESGLPISAIAAKLPHRSKHAIEMQLWKIGLTTKRGGITPWTEEENAIIKEGFKNHLTHRQIAEKLENRTPKATQAQAGKLGLLARSSQPWSTEEDCIIEKSYRCKDSLKKITQKLPGRTEKAVGMRASKLGLSPKNKKEKWTKEETDILVNSCKKGLCASDISNLLPNRTEHAVNMKIMRLKKSNSEVFTTNTRTMDRE